jgi:hypothetical protein
MKYHKIPAVGTRMGLDKQDLVWIQSALQEAINGLLKLLGDGNYILAGVEESGTQLTDGWIYYNGELLRFKGGAINAKFVIIDEEQTSGTYDYEKYATPGTGVGDITLANLVRLKDIQTISAKIDDIDEALSSIVSTLDDVNEVIYYLTVDSGIQNGSTPVSSKVEYLWCEVRRVGSTVYVNGRVQFKAASQGDVVFYIDNSVPQPASDQLFLAIGSANSTRLRLEGNSHTVSLQSNAEIGETQDFNFCYPVVGE